MSSILWPLDQIPDIVLGDLDPEFVKILASEMAWEYDRLYDFLALHSDGLPDPFLNHEFACLRGKCATSAMHRACQRHGVPYEFRRLECNGQRKILSRVGRLVLIQEPMLTLTDHPRASDYKVQLAESHGILRQIEFDLGDILGRILDWDDCILAVVLHGATGPWFTKDHKKLGGLMLGIPDASYNHWVRRFDLMRLALTGDNWEADEPAEAPVQQDRVTVTLKNKNQAAGEE